MNEYRSPRIVVHVLVYPETETMDGDHEILEILPPCPEDDDAYSQLDKGLVLGACRCPRCWAASYFEAVGIEDDLNAQGTIDRVNASRVASVVALSGTMWSEGREYDEYDEGFEVISIDIRPMEVHDG